ncbi:hypothetical protein BOQ63_014100 [Streptomyces viridifaciens]|nr:hypothetical protein CP971_07250 [Streptomyces viridifaciens]UKZ05159.1 hypothetical protein BOQ63_014100 [Streptomyces viridifaciens]
MSLPRPLHALTVAVLVAVATLGPAGAAGADPAPALPSADQLKSALLGVDDLGPDYTEAPTPDSPSPSPSPSADPTPVTGCDALSALITMHATAPGPVTPQAETELDGQDGSPMVTESLTAVDPGRLTTDFNTATDAFKTCHTITFNAGTEDSVTFTVTPVTLGDRQDAPAVRLDGTLAGVQLNAFVGIERFGTVGMVYGFFQRESSEAQTASMQYRTAVAKVERTLGTTAGSTTPPTASAVQGMSV